MKPPPLLMLLALAGCAAPEPPSPHTARQCFFAGSVNGYREVGEEALHLRVGVNQVWRLDFQGLCPDLEWAGGRLALLQRSGGSICRGSDVDVVLGDQTIPRRCWVRDVRRLSDAEAAALPPDQRP